MVSSFLCRILLGTNQHYIEVASTVLPFRILWGINEFVMFIIASHFFIFYTDLEEKRLQEDYLLSVLRLRRSGMRIPRN